MNILNLAPKEEDYLRNILTLFGCGHLRQKCEKILDRYFELLNFLKILNLSRCRLSSKFDQVEINALICGILYILSKFQFFNFKYFKKNKPKSQFKNI